MPVVCPDSPTTADRVRAGSEPAIPLLPLQRSGPHRQEPLATVAGGRQKGGPFPSRNISLKIAASCAGASLSQVVPNNSLSLPTDTSRSATGSLIKNLSAECLQLPPSRPPRPPASTPRPSFASSPISTRQTPRSWTATMRSRSASWTRSASSSTRTTRPLAPPARKSVRITTHSPS